jgi:hypothetical protein
MWRFDQPLRNTSPHAHVRSHAIVRLHNRCPQQARNKHI